MARRAPAEATSVDDSSHGGSDDNSDDAAGKHEANKRGKLLSLRDDGKYGIFCAATVATYCWCSHVVLHLTRNIERSADDETVSVQHQHDASYDDDASSLSSTPLMVLKMRRIEAMKSSIATAKATKRDKNLPPKATRTRNKATRNKSVNSAKASIPDEDANDNLQQLAKITAAKEMQAKKKSASNKNEKYKATSVRTNTAKTNRTTLKTHRAEATPTLVAKTKASHTGLAHARAKAVETSSSQPTAANNTSNESSEDKAVVENKERSSISNHDDELEEAACCLCHCGVDCSDRALFFPKDRKQELEEDEDYYFKLEDPYLDERLYDRSNALVYCDTCGRLYHQKCHFVPLLVVPRGDWNCLICTIQQHAKQQTKQPTPNRKRKRSGGPTIVVDMSATFRESPSYKKFLDRRVTDHLFQSPPRVIDSQLAPTITSSSVSDASPPLRKSTKEVLALQKEWELASASAKAILWQLQIRQLKTFLNSQASNIRMANAALTTLTSTKRNRQHFSNKAAKSQELAQTIVRQTGAKFKIRDALVSLDNIRTRDESVDFSCLLMWCQEYPQHAAHVFPFGAKLWQENRRVVPRTRERIATNVEAGTNGNVEGPTAASKISSGAIPKEIHLNSPPSSPGKKNGTLKSSKNATVCSTSSVATATAAKCIQNGCDSKVNCRAVAAKRSNDDDSGVTLDDLQCSICMIGDSSDENDVILCDGQGCHRAFHMKCVYPAVSPKDIEIEDENWFCPICLGLSKLMGEMHALCISSEGAGDDDEDDCSAASWENARDIFAESEWEYETALKLSKGKRNEDTQRLLAMFLGEETVDRAPQMPIGSDSEDENDYSLFDEESFEERKRRNREHGVNEDDDTTRSSDASLADMSSMEYQVAKAELAALSEEDEDSDEDTDEGSNDINEGGRMRRSRRLSKRAKAEEGESKSGEFGADFSEANILEGKRTRKIVDYRKLNDALFGGLTHKEQVLIDDTDDFVAKNTQQKGDVHSDSGSENGTNDGNSASSKEKGDDKSNEDTSESGSDGEKSEQSSDEEGEDSSDTGGSSRSEDDENDGNDHVGSDGSDN